MLRTSLLVSLCLSAACSGLGIGLTAADALPDRRAYELVSPPVKNNGDVIGYTARTRAASDGDALQFSSLSGFADVRGGGIAPDYMSVRNGKAGTSGWATHALTPGGLEPQSFFDNYNGFDASFVAEFSPDLTKAVFMTTTPLTGGSPNTVDVPKLYLRTGNMRIPGAGTYRLLTDCVLCPSPFLTQPFARPVMAGASSGFNHIVFESDRSLTGDVPFCDPAVSSCPGHLYEWAEGKVRFAGILPDGSAAPNSQAGQGANLGDHYTPGTISQDGGRIFFTVHGALTSAAGQLYMRQGNGTTGATTVRINESEHHPPASTPSDARFWFATLDGGKAIFTTMENLTDGDTSDENRTDLYSYDASAPAGERLTLISVPDVGESADVTGVVGASEDASYVYFVSATQLLNNGSDTIGPRLFLWHDGVTQEVAKVNDQELGLFGEGGWRQAPLTSRVTPDGRRLVFTTKGTDELPHTGAGDTCALTCEEVYLYDATANSGQGELTCVSCHADPATPGQTDAGFVFQVGRAASEKSSHLNHPLSDDGRFVFFSTGDQLVPEDRNGRTRDVYEYDALSGSVHLLSSGKAGSFPAYFMEATPSGHDVFLVTRERLTASHDDDGFDLYDARVDGGVREPPLPLAMCSEDACQGPQVAKPTFAPPATRAFRGTGNLRNNKDKRACKRRAQRRTKCVKHKRRLRKVVRPMAKRKAGRRHV